MHYKTFLFVSRADRSARDADLFTNLEDDYEFDLRSVALYFGYDEDDVVRLLSDGYLPEEIEEMMYGRRP